jgi:hypothetical protein
MEDLLTQLFSLFRDCRTSENESFGDFCYRIGPDDLKAYIDTLNKQEPVDEMKERFKTIAMPQFKWENDFIGGVPDIKYEMTKSTVTV